MNGPGKSHRKGISLLELGRNVPHRGSRYEVVRGADVARRAGLPEVRKRKDHRDPEPEADALLVLRLPVLLLGADGYSVGAVEGAATEVGVRGLHHHDQLEERVQHEAPPGPGRDAEDGVVHAPPAPGSMGDRERRDVRGSGRSG